MKIKNYYSCQVCGLDFETEQELIIKVGFSPLCSNRCIFKLYYKIFSSYSQEKLLYLAKLLGILEPTAQAHNELLFSITKKYPKDTLSNINKQAQGSSSEKQALEPRVRLTTSLYIEM